MGSVLENRAWFAQVLDRGGEIVGAGFAIDASRMLTCAHVVKDAGAAGPGETVRVMFPLLNAGCEARVLDEGWAEPRESSGDVAVLALVSAPAAVRRAPVATLDSLHGLAFTAYGFPDGYDDGISVEGHLGRRVGRAQVQLEIASQLAVELGYSGAAVWSDAHAAVVAMMVTRDAATAGRVAFAIPMRTLAGLFSPLELDPDTTTHWGPRSRGVNSDFDEAGWLFTGRRRALSELVEWLGDIAQPAVRTVTGGPGTGKSAVLARLVTTSDRRYRTRIPGLDGADPTVPSAGAIDVTFHAKGQTVGAFVEHVAATCDLLPSGGDAGALVEAVREAGGRRVIVVDAVDEASEPRALCALLRDLGEQGCRILAGCRDHLLGELGDANPLRLDEAPYVERVDIATYVTRLLEAREPGRPPDPALVAEISDAAQGNFLVAQVVALAIAIGGSLQGPLPRSVAPAFDRLLAALPDPTTTRELLVALAYAKGDGLPMGLWHSASSALSRPYHRADIDELLRGPAAAFLITRLDDPGGARYRLFHEALAETLTWSRDTRSDHELLWDTWTDGLSGGWQHAPAYLLQHGAEHAAEAGALAALAVDVSYLLHADLSRLLTQVAKSDRADDEPVARLAATLRLAAARLQPLDPSERDDVIELTERHLGLPARADELPVRGRFTPSWAHRLGDPHQPLGGHTDWVNDVAIGMAGDGAIIASASHDETVRMWDATSGEAVGGALTGHSGAVSGVAIGSVDGGAIIASAGDDETVRVWDAVSGKRVGEPLTGHSARVNRVTIGVAGGRAIIASAGDDGTVRLWDAASGEAVGAPLTGHAGAVAAVAIGTAAGRAIIVTGGRDQTVRRWDAVSGEAIGEPMGGHAGRVNGVAIAAVGGRATIASAGDDATIRLWDARTGRAVGEPMRGHTGRVTAVAFGTADGRAFVASAGSDGTLRMWDASSCRALREPLTGHTDLVSAVACGMASGQPLLASASSDGTVRLWGALGGRAVGEPLSGHAGRVGAVAVGTARGRALLVSAGSDQTVRLWDPETGLAVGEPRTGHSDPVNAIAIGTAAVRRRGRLRLRRSRDRVVIVSAGMDKTVRVWDAITGAPIGRPLAGHTDWVTGVAIGPAGGRTIIASASWDRTVRVWDALSGARVGEPLTGHAGRVNGVAIGSAGERAIIVSASADQTVRLWDAVSGEPISEPLSGHTGAVGAVATGMLGSRAIIASASWDLTVRLWDVASARTIGEPLRGHTGDVGAVAIGAIGGRAIVASAGEDRTVRLWDARTHEAVQVIHMLDAPRALAFDAAGALYVAAGLAICRFERPLEDPGEPPDRPAPGL